MNVAVGFAGLLAAVFVWWLAYRRLRTKPWEWRGAYEAHDAPRTPSARIGLWIFLAVVTSFFCLFLAAYAMRMRPSLINGTVFRDWLPLIEPRLLWLNTLFLALGSAGMQVARVAIGRGQRERTLNGLLAGGAFATAFLVGQWFAWQQLRASGIYAQGNPAYAFFYALTGLHALHLFGGMVVWARTTGHSLRATAPDAGLALKVELCTVYWHYLLVVWLVLFGFLLIT